MQTHVHEESGEAIEGLQLVPGAIIRPEDIFASAHGWEKPGYKDIPLRHPKMKWVRPCDITRVARAMLIDLTRRANPRFLHIFGTKMVVACHENYQAICWDEIPESNSPEETVQELIDCGYIERISVFGRVYGVTDRGRERVTQLKQQN